MFTTKAILRSVLTLAVASAVVACGANGGPGGSAQTQGGWVGSVGENASYVSWKLTDKPTDDAVQVNINVVQVELFVSKGADEHRIIIGQDVGMVDVLQLQNGVLKGLGNLILPPGVTIHQLRLVLGDGNNLVHKDGSVCELKTPSAQQSGVKLVFTPELTTEANYRYDITLDFDVDHSIVMQGNGGCLLKPVIKVKTATRTPVAPAPVPTPMPVPNATAQPAPQPSAQPSATPVQGATPVPTASATPAGDWAPTPTGPTQTLPTSGTSNGTFTNTTSPADPATTTPSTLWM